MNITLATGIYPPDIGGPATYCRNLAEQLVKRGHEVTVITYGDGRMKNEERKMKNEWEVEYVSKALPIARWFWYAQKLRECSADADVVYAFSSVSAGLPLAISGLKKPKKILRLGGDFAWERATDRGYQGSLREFCASKKLLHALGRRLMHGILRRFDSLVFSTDFQRDLYASTYADLPTSSVIENALSLEHVVPLEHHELRRPLKLLFMGRLVSFKQVPKLISALKRIPNAVLTVVGDGPMESTCHRLVSKLELAERVRFVGPLRGKEKYEVFGSHDLLVLPSLTEISPNTALEARSVGLPVLLTKEQGLSTKLTGGMAIADLSTTDAIVQEVERVVQGYSVLAEAAATSIEGRPWTEVTEETIALFKSVAC